MEFATMYSNLLRDDNKSVVLFTHSRRREIMADVSKLIFGAAIAAASIATPALAAHKGKPISAHQNGDVTRSSQGSGAKETAYTIDSALVGWGYTK